MLYGKNDQHTETDFLEPVFGSRPEDRPIPKYHLRQEPMEPRIAYRLVKDQLLDEGVALR